MTLLLMGKKKHAASCGSRHAMLVGKATAVRFGKLSLPGKPGYVLSVEDQKATEGA